MLLGGIIIVKILALLMLLFMNVSVLNYYDFAPITEDNKLFIGKQISPISIVSDRFLSFGLDTSEIATNVKYLLLDSAKLISLTSLLRPSHMRLGGTMSDRLIFMEDLKIEHRKKTLKQYNKESKDVCNENICPGKFLPFFIMNGADWLTINDFCNKTGTRMLFDLNVLLRDGDHWDPNNAIDLMKFSKKNNLNIDWQLGNEPNSFKHVFNISISPQQLSLDFKQLKHLVDTYFPMALLIGPDTTRPQPRRPECVQYMKEFLADSSSFIDVIGWHQYYLNGRTATVDDFWNPDVLNLLQSQIDTMTQTIEPYRNDLPMWLTETSSAYGGGAPDLSNSFAGSPLWLDKLGIASSNGIQVVVRQSLIGGNYSLIDTNLNPLPDWWISVVYKKIVGHKVVACQLNSSKFQRFYCHCTNKKYENYSKGSLTIYGMNLLNSSTDLILDVHDIDSGITLDEFLFTSTNGDRKSKRVNLNEEELTYTDRPKLLPKHLGNVRSIHMPKFSLGFWVIQNTNIFFC